VPIYHPDVSAAGQWTEDELKSKKQNLFQRYALAWFFFFAYFFNFALLGIHLYIVEIRAPWLNLLQVFSPTYSAILVAALIGGTTEIRRLLSGWTRWKVSWVWYLAAFSMILIPLIVAIVYMVIGNPVEGLQSGATLGAFLSSLLMAFLAGPISEETGWRGFVLPRLQAKYNALVSSLILGFFWAFWHLPFYLTPGSSSQGNFPLFIFVPIVFALTILFTWVYNNTKGSLLLTMLMHFSFNSTSIFLTGFFGILPQSLLFTVAGPLLGILMVVVVFVAGPKNLSKKRVT
jgi:membrane protease YdiL (CAAX protease family)